MRLCTKIDGRYRRLPFKHKTKFALYENTELKHTDENNNQFIYVLNKWVNIDDITARSDFWRIVLGYIAVMLLFGLSCHWNNAVEQLWPGEKILAYVSIPFLLICVVWEEFSKDLFNHS